MSLLTYKQPNARKRRLNIKKQLRVNRRIHRYKEFIKKINISIKDDRKLLYNLQKEYNNLLFEEGDEIGREHQE